MRLIRWQRVRSSVDGLPFEPVVVTQAGRRKLAGAKEPSQRIRRIRELTMGVVASQNTNGIVDTSVFAVPFVFMPYSVDGTPCAMKVARMV